VLLAQVQPGHRLSCLLNLLSHNLLFGRMLIDRLRVEVQLSSDLLLCESNVSDASKQDF
jgi:hypothetical protein